MKKKFVLALDARSYRHWSVANGRPPVQHLHCTCLLHGATGGKYLVLPGAQRSASYTTLVNRLQSANFRAVVTLEDLLRD